MTGTATDLDGRGVYCRSQEHDRCTMVCSCSCHRQIGAVRAITARLRPDVDPVLELIRDVIGAAEKGKAIVAHDGQGRRVCPACDSLLVRPNLKQGRYPRVCGNCAERLKAAGG